jgi:hypothetical protein
MEAANGEDIFYSDSEAEQDLKDTLQATNSKKTAFRLGHAAGTQELIEHEIRRKRKKLTESEKLTQTIDSTVDRAHAQAKSVHKHTDQLTMALKLVKGANHTLTKQVEHMEQQARYQEIRWRSLKEKVRIQEHIIQDLTKMLDDMNKSSTTTA